MRRPMIRMLLYVAGLCIIAIGINLAVKSALGVSPVSAFTVPIGQISGVSLGAVTVAVYAVFVLIQLAVLGRRFRPKLLLQMPFSMAFGWFINRAGPMLGWVQPTGYVQQMALLLLSIAVCSLGAALYIAMDLVPNPPEGLILAVCARFGVAFSRVKLVSDCVFVALGVALSLLFMGRVTTIREGTVIAALLTGRLIGLFSARIGPTLRRLAFDPKTDAGGVAHDA